MSRRKANKTGRSLGTLANFMGLEIYLITSPAWRDLSSNARPAYNEIASGHDGRNNGRIVFSVYLVAKNMTVGKSTAARALLELEQHGFAERLKKGAFRLNPRRAREELVSYLRVSVRKVD